MQESSKKEVQFCNLYLNLPEQFGASVTTIQTQLSFTTHLNLLQPDDLVKEFTAVIAQDGQLVDVGDYVQLCSPQNAVYLVNNCTCVIM